jgi:hypothetical protein
MKMSDTDKFNNNNNNNNRKVNFLTVLKNCWIYITDTTVV